MGKDRPAQQTGDTRQDSRTRQADQAGPDRIDLDSRWAAALDCPPVQAQAATFDFRPTQMAVIHSLIETAGRWGDTAVLRFLNENPDSWPKVWRQFQDTLAMMADCCPDVPTGQVRRAARLIVVGWIDYRLLERGTILEFRARIEAAWRKLHVGEERLP